MIIVRNATDNKLINISGKSLAPDEFVEVEESAITPGIRALIMRGEVVLSRKEVVRNESLELLKQIDEEKEENEEDEEVKAEETEETEEAGEVKSEEEKTEEVSGKRTRKKKVE